MPNEKELEKLKPRTFEMPAHYGEEQQQYTENLLKNFDSNTVGSEFKIAEGKYASAVHTRDQAMQNFLQQKSQELKIAEMAKIDARPLLTRRSKASKKAKIETKYSDAAFVSGLLQRYAAPFGSSPEEVEKKNEDLRLAIYAAERETMRTADLNKASLYTYDKMELLQGERDFFITMKQDYSEEGIKKNKLLADQYLSKDPSMQELFVDDLCTRVLELDTSALQYKNIKEQIEHSKDIQNILQFGTAACAILQHAKMPETDDPRAEQFYKAFEKCDFLRKMAKAYVLSTRLTQVGLKDITQLEMREAVLKTYVGGDEYSAQNDFLNRGFLPGVTNYDERFLNQGRDLIYSIEHDIKNPEEADLKLREVLEKKLYARSKDVFFRILRRYFLSPQPVIELSEATIKVMGSMLEKNTFEISQQDIRDINAFRERYPGDGKTVSRPYDICTAIAGKSIEDVLLELKRLEREDKYIFQIQVSALLSEHMPLRSVQDVQTIIQTCFLDTNVYADVALDKATDLIYCFLPQLPVTMVEAYLKRYSYLEKANMELFTKMREIWLDRQAKASGLAEMTLNSSQRHDRTARTWQRPVYRDQQGKPLTEQDYENVRYNIAMDKALLDHSAGKDTESYKPYLNAYLDEMLKQDISPQNFTLKNLEKNPMGILLLASQITALSDIFSYHLEDGIEESKRQQVALYHELTAPMAQVIAAGYEKLGYDFDGLSILTKGRHAISPRTIEEKYSYEANLKVYTQLYNAAIAKQKKDK